MKDTVLMDIDGTLLDTREFILQSYEATIREYGGIEYDRAQLITFINGTLEEVYTQALPGHDLVPLMAAHAKHQSEHLDLITLYEGVYETLQSMRSSGLKMAAVTNRKRPSAMTNLALHKLDSLLDYVVTPEDVVRGKPDPESLNRALRYFGRSTDTAIMIGDAQSDIVAGLRAGTVTIGVTHGFSTRDQLVQSGAHHIIDSFGEVLRFLD